MPAPPARTLLAVIGNPVAHSKSPQIHAAFAAQFGIDVEYRRILGASGAFAATVDAFRAEGARGMNVTLPFKREAHDYADDLSSRARRAGAVNTLLFEDRGCRGDNTDGIGLVRDLSANHGLAIEGRRLLLLGAGGAARGVLEPLLACHPALLHIANRTATRAHALAGDFADLGRVTGSGFAELPGTGFDLVINATAASLANEVPPLPDRVLAAGASVYDLLYAAEPTPFMRWASERGAARSLDGLGMLVEQAAESFALWLSRRPDTAPVLAAMRS